MDDFLGLIVLFFIDIFARERARKLPDWSERVKQERKWTWFVGGMILVVTFLFTFFYS